MLACEASTDIQLTVVPADLPSVVAEVHNANWSKRFVVVGKSPSPSFGTNKSSNFTKSARLFWNLPLDKLSQNQNHDISSEYLYCT